MRRRGQSWGLALALLMVAAMLPVTVAYAQTGGLVNGSFEAGFAPWQGTDVAQLDSVTVRSGTTSGRVDTPLYHDIWQEVTLTGGQSFDFGGYFYKGVTDAEAHIRFWSSTGDFILDSNKSCVADLVQSTWVFCGRSWTAPSSGTYRYGFTTKERIYFDDQFVGAVAPEPTPVPTPAIDPGVGDGDCTGQLVRVGAIASDPRMTRDAAAAWEQANQAVRGTAAGAWMTTYSSDIMRPISFVPTGSNQIYKSWHKSGRAIDLPQQGPGIEHVADGAYERLYVAGVDITAIMEALGWTRIPSSATRPEWWHYEYKNGYSWESAMAQIYPLSTLQQYFADTDWTGVDACEGGNTTDDGGWFDLFAPIKWLFDKLKDLFMPTQQDWEEIEQALTALLNKEPIGTVQELREMAKAMRGEMNTLYLAAGGGQGTVAESPGPADSGGSGSAWDTSGGGGTAWAGDSGGGGTSWANTGTVCGGPSWFETMLGCFWNVPTVAKWIGVNLNELSTSGPQFALVIRVSSTGALWFGLWFYVRRRIKVVA